jgi:hypothetical protein
VQDLAVILHAKGVPQRESKIFLQILVEVIGGKEFESNVINICTYNVPDEEAHKDAIGGIHVTEKSEQHHEPNRGEALDHLALHKP